MFSKMSSSNVRKGFMAKERDGISVPLVAVLITSLYNVKRGRYEMLTFLEAGTEWPRAHSLGKCPK